MRKSNTQQHQKQTQITNNQTQTDVYTYLDLAEDKIKEFQGAPPTIQIEKDGVKENVYVVFDDATFPPKTWDNKTKLEDFLKNCKGTPTIGYGLTGSEFINKGTLNISDADKQVVDHITIVDEMLKNTLKDVYTNLNNNQKAALISLYYNIGSTSTTPKLIKALKENNKAQVAKQFLDCNKVDGKEVKGLTKRRKIESELFLTKPESKN